MSERANPDLYSGEPDDPLWRLKQVLGPYPDHTRTLWGLIREVERLRANAEHAEREWSVNSRACDDAEAELERLRAKYNGLRHALYEVGDVHGPGGMRTFAQFREEVEIRAAVQPKKG